MKITCVFILLFLFHLNVNAQSDCPDAIIVCGDANYFDLEAEGIGQTPEISPDNACASGENNTIWLKIQINQGGTLGFILTPTEDDMVIDFDFWLFGPIEECGIIGTAIRCSTTNPLQANLNYITTGMNETETDVSEGPGPNGNGFVQWITVQDNEFYYLVIDRPHGFGNFSMEWTGTATFHAVPQFLNPNNIPLDIIQCDKDGVNDQSTAFDLTVYEDMFIGTQSPVEITYHENLNDATIGEDPIALPEAYPNTSNPQIIYLRMTNTVTGCYSTETFTINITPPMVAGQPLNMELCDDNKNGVQTFDLSSNDIAVINDNPESFVTYHTSLEDARDGVNAVGPLFENEAPIQTIWARLENAEGCYSYDFNFFTISILPLPVFNNPGNLTLDLHICENGQDDHTAVFDLTLYKDILIGDQSNVILTYHENNDEANAGDNEIQSPTIYTNTASPQTIYMRLANIETGCFDILPFDITVYDIKAGEPENMAYCDLDDDGLNEFDLALNDNNVKNGNTDSGVTYYKSFDDAVSRQNQIGPLYQTTIPYSTETLWARLERTTPVCVVYDIKSFTISVKPLPVFNNPDNISFDLYKCDTDGIDDQSTPFDLRVHTGVMIGTQNNIAITYYEDITDAEIDDNRIAAPNNYANTSNPQTIYVRLTNTVTGCFRVTNFQIHILPSPQAYILPALQVCDDNNDGTAFFGLDSIIQSIQNTISNTIVTIHETPEDAIFGQNIITDTDAYPNNELNTQTLYIRVESTLTHCFDTTTLQLIVNPLPEAITPKSYILCDDGNSDTDGEAVFNLTTKAAEVLGTLNPALYSVSYYLTQANAEAGTPAIGNPISYLSESGEVFIKVTNNATGCYDIVKLKLIVNLLPTAVQPTVALTLCDVTAPLMDGIEIFDLTSVIPSIIGAQQGINVTFHHSYAE
ncbi:hypothetical protein [Flavobacterium cerinum]|uniref:Gliding motility-associated C-terminal domain-containing protein n=1 Tax=Flavobacterium cerinum TaxID=2502784 RepID=A0A3S3TV96_9FLAO|nr:hypothetical protein [Flavobacterium cerinum]RWW92015.1 hypothetical protein EPI11_16555 [Flavobacterium cerinum]